MAGWQRIRSRVLCIENGVSLVLLILAALLIAPAIQSFAPSTAQVARTDLARRMKAVEERARTDGRLYTVQFTPASGKIVVLRWLQDKKNGSLQPEQVHPCTGSLLTGTVVVGTTFPDQVFTVSEHGFPLTRGHVDLRAPDGSCEILELGVR